MGYGIKQSSDYSEINFDTLPICKYLFLQLSNHMLSLPFNEFNNFCSDQVPNCNL